MTIEKQEGSFSEIEALEPKKVLKYMTTNIKTLSNFLIYLANSPSFDFSCYPMIETRKFMDLVVFNPHNIKKESYFTKMFQKIWCNPHSREYFLTFMPLCKVPYYPLPYLKKMIEVQTPEEHEVSLKRTLQAIA